MKKWIPIAIVVIVLVAIGLYMKNKQNTPQQLDRPLTEMSPETNTQVPGSAAGNIVNSIKDAMGLGKKLRCTYADPQNPNVSSTVFIDGETMKFTSTVNGETVNGIFNGTTQYTWTTKTNQGFKMDKTCMDEVNNPSSEESGQIQPTPTEDYQAIENTQNVTCEPAESEDFSIPSNINFVDQCEMIRNSMKALENMKQNLPQGIDIPARY